MIEIEFISSPDIFLSGKVRFFRDLMTIGRNDQNFIQINDPKLSPKHLDIEVTEKGVIISNKNRGPFFHTNGKRVSGIKLHKAGDIVKIGDTEFSIVSFKPEEKDEDLVKLLQANQESAPYLEELFLQLEKEIVQLEREINK